VEAIGQLRQEHMGWGAITILLEIHKDPRFLSTPLPSRARVAAYFKEKNWVKKYERHQALPQPKLQSVTRLHQRWEMDAQGVLHVTGLGGVSILNIQDLFSHWKVGSLACLHTNHPNTQDHQLLLRRAFYLYGLPEEISLDHDSVYIDTRPPPLPHPVTFVVDRLRIGVRFIQQPPPYEHARIERGHQTVTQQALVGQTFEDPGALHTTLAARLDFLNREYPCRSLQDQPPLIAYPQALQTLRPYRPEWEKEILDLHAVYAYLAKGRWLRSTSSIATFSLGSQRYYAASQYVRQTLEITFDPQTCEFICLPEKGTQPLRRAALGLTKETLMGELDPLLSIPNYQLALPLSRQAWREMQHFHQLSGTT
jgi:hypothetical protein